MQLFNYLNLEQKTTIPHKIFGTKLKTPLKLDRKRKV